MTEQQIKKGLFRLWIVVSVCWVCYWGFERLTGNLTEGGIKTEWIGLVPPVILLILGKSIFWILKGFKKSD